VTRLISLLGALAAVVVLAACGDSSTIATPTDTGGAATDSGGASAPADTTADTGAATTSSSSADTLANGCRRVTQPGAKKEPKVTKPTTKLSTSKTYTVVLKTSCGTIQFKLDTKNDPKTAANVAYLVKKKYYDGLSFHRVVPGFVIQGGDPLGTGAGGPGYSVVEAPPKDQQYTHGVVAMAKAGSDPSGASGSQFFIVTGDNAGLPPEYAVAGTVSSGLSVADKIGAIPPQGGQDGPPAAPVVIDKATLKVS
jgi:peptidyl-prolyl cis-trans isomerase B (cyclophilin B)